MRHVAVPLLRRAAPSALDRLREVTEQHGATLAPRLTIYPEMADDPDRWLDPAMWLPARSLCRRGPRPGRPGGPLPPACERHPWQRRRRRRRARQWALDRLAI